MKVIPLAILLFAVSCGSADVTKPTRPEYAPKDYKPRGIVKYLNDGLESMRASRKEDAFKRMHDNCNGKYKVLDESPREESPGISHGTSTGGSVWAASQYLYISYECLD